MLGNRWTGAIGLLLLACATTLGAQAVRGVAVLPDGATPLAGVIVVANDGKGASAGRALTGKRGEFTITLPAPGKYQLRLLRIGYRPTIGPTVDVGQGITDSIKIVFAAEAVTLSAMNTRERETCRVSADSGLMVARVWEEARKAMMTTQLTTAGAPLVAEWIEYDRVLDSSARMVRQQHVSTKRNPTTHAFKSLPAATLDAKGYIVVEGAATTYYAPDADALLSDAFVGGHCFHLAETPPSQTNLVGVSFQPTRARRDLPEIEGTLWVDRTTAELRTLDFRYTNMPDVAEPAHAGGHVEFLRLSDGNWLISRWNVRMPQLTRGTLGSGAVTTRVIARSALVLHAIQLTGGEVNRVFRDDSLLYQSTGPTLVVQVVGVDPIVSPAGAIVTLDGTDYSGTADAAGRLRMSPILAGRYRARVHTPFMDTLRLEPVAGEVEAREGMAVHVDSLKLPSSRDALAGACPRDSIRNGEGLLHGRVMDSHARPLDHAAVTVVWQTDIQTDPTHVDFREHTLGALSNADGYWQICGVPRNYALSVRVASDSGSDVRRARLDEGESLGSIDLVAHQESAAAREAAIATTSAGARERALVEFAVVDAQGAPIANVALDVNAVGVQRTVVTGPTGRALIPELAPGRMGVRARRVGYKEGEVIAIIAAGRNTVPIVLSDVSAPELDTVRVIGNRRVLSMKGRFDEFEQRRINGQATVSMTAEDIHKRNPVSLWQMLNGIPSIKVVDNDTMVGVMSTRTIVPNLVGPSIRCWMAIGINGQILPHDSSHPTTDLRTLPAIDEVYGIEVFAGASNIPLQYGGVGEGKWCGLIMIWTK